jgi:hypothetical protein
MQLGFHDGLTTHRRGGCTDEDRSGEELVNELYRRKAKRTDRKTNSNGIKKPLRKKISPLQPRETAEWLTGGTD